MNELLSSDIVLTTYDVLKEDLSHDSDRHEGDRRCMRFQKRYSLKIYLMHLCTCMLQSFNDCGRKRVYFNSSRSVYKGMFCASI